MSNIWAHDIAERMRIRRKVFAKDSGLGDMDVGTFPAEGATHTLIDRGTNPLLGMLLTGVLAGGLGGLGTYAAMVSNLTSGVTDSSLPTISAPKDPPPTLGPIDLEIEVINGGDGPVIESVVVPPDAD